jgi:hypothetical protein
MQTEAIALKDEIRRLKEQKTKAKQDEDTAKDAMDNALPAKRNRRGQDVIEKQLQLDLAQANSNLELSIQACTSARAADNLAKTALAVAKKAHKQAKDDEAKSAAADLAQEAKYDSIERLLEADLRRGDMKRDVDKKVERLKAYRQTGQVPEGVALVAAVADDDKETEEQDETQPAPVGSAADEAGKNPATISSSSSSSSSSESEPDAAKADDDKETGGTGADEDVNGVPAVDAAAGVDDDSEMKGEGDGDELSASSNPAAAASKKPRSHKRKSEQVDLQNVPPGVNRNDARNFEKAQQNPRQKRL